MSTSPNAGSEQPVGQTRSIRRRTKTKKSVVELTRRNIQSIRDEIDRGADIDPDIVAALEAEFQDYLAKDG